MNETMEEEKVLEANRKMRQTTHIGNILFGMVLGVQIGIIIIANTLVSNTDDAIFIIMATGIMTVTVIGIIAIWKDRAIFNVAIALLKYIDTNYPDVRLPPNEYEDTKRGKLG